MIKKTMTFDELDALYERIGSSEFRCETWPSLTEVKHKVANSPKKEIEFLIWILETSNEPENEDEERVKRYINRLLIDTIEIVD